MTCVECGRELGDDDVVVIESYNARIPTRQIRSACCWAFLLGGPIPPLPRIPLDIQDAIAWEGVRP